MGEKKNRERLSIKFDPTIASNVQAMRILDVVGQRKQAQIIAEALVLYNQVYGLIDTANPLVVSPVLPQTVNSTVQIVQPVAPSSTISVSEEPKETSFADEYNASLNSNDDFEYDEEYDEEYDDEAYDDIFANSLTEMGITPNN